MIQAEAIRKHLSKRWVAYLLCIIAVMAIGLALIIWPALIVPPKVRVYIADLKVPVYPGADNIVDESGTYRKLQYRVPATQNPAAIPAFYATWLKPSGEWRRVTRKWASPSGHWITSPYIKLQKDAHGYVPVEDDYGELLVYRDIWLNSRRHVYLILSIIDYSKLQASARPAWATGDRPPQFVVVNLRPNAKVDRQWWLGNLLIAATRYGATRK